MTDITIQHSHGTGINGVYGVYRGGKLVATIKRTGHRDYWGIYSTHYHRQLAGAPDVARAKQTALTLTYPTKEEIYATICAEVEPARRRHLEMVHHHDFVRLSREIVNGSNSARVELEQLLASIEEKAKDRRPHPDQEDIPSTYYQNPGQGRLRYPEAPKLDAPDRALEVLQEVSKDATSANEETKGGGNHGTSSAEQKAI